jgi:hypothetical protein
MPTPRRYPLAAARQAAYRARLARQRQPEHSNQNLPPLPAVSPLPGYRRWHTLLHHARSLTQIVTREMQGYYHERSESWQDSERGEAFQERLAAAEEVEELLDLWVSP